MAYYNAKAFPSRAAAVAALEAANFTLEADGETFSRTASNISSHVCVGQCRSGQWLIMATPPRVRRDNAGRAYGDAMQAQ